MNYINTLANLANIRLVTCDFSSALSILEPIIEISEKKLIKIMLLKMLMHQYLTV